MSSSIDRKAQLIKLFLPFYLRKENLYILVCARHIHMTKIKEFSYPISALFLFLFEIGQGLHIFSLWQSPRKLCYCYCHFVLTHFVYDQIMLQSTSIVNLILFMEIRNLIYNLT